MKLTESRIKQIIQEELEMFENELPKDQEKPPPSDPDSKSKLSKGLKKLSLEILQMKGLDKNEILLLNQIINLGLSLAQDGNAKTPLVMALRKLGAEVK